METLQYLTDMIGPRLTGSPACKRANEWTMRQLASWGLADAHLEAWGPFGRGWSVKRFSLQIVDPYTIVLNAYPKAWSPGFARPFEAAVVHLDAQRDEDLEKFKGQLEGVVVLIGQSRDVQARFEPLASRMDDAELSRLAALETGSNTRISQPRTDTASERRAQFAESGARAEALMNRSRRSTTGPATGPTTRRGRRDDLMTSRAMEFAMAEGALLAITPSNRGDGGTLFVQGASIPGEPRRSTTEPSTGPATEPAPGPTTRPRVWHKDAPKILPQATLAIEDFNRLTRMLNHGQKLTLLVDLQVYFHDADEMAYNTIAEIPGSDLKDEIVMIGAHMDSWHSGTGTTDNAVGVAAAMEAVRIIRALNLQPRRTIRIGLWTGEEQGIFGSEAYVKKHFGHDPDAAARREAARARRDAQERDPNSDPDAATQPASQPAQKRIVKEPEYEKFSAYFNLDNGTGKIRGIYAQSSEAAASIFQKWLVPFADLGATTVTMSNTGGTDHLSFDAIGLPGFQFIQDPIEYGSRTHHSNYDVYDRAQAEDLKQASTIMAAFVWEAANMDERFPRKPVNAEVDRRSP